MRTRKPAEPPSRFLEGRSAADVQRQARPALGARAGVLCSEGPAAATLQRVAQLVAHSPRLDAQRQFKAMQQDMLAGAAAPVWRQAEDSSPAHGPA